MHMDPSGHQYMRRVRHVASRCVASCVLNPRSGRPGRLPHTGVPEIVSRPTLPLRSRLWEKSNKSSKNQKLSQAKEQNCLAPCRNTTRAVALWPLGVGADFWYSSMRLPPLAATAQGADPRPSSNRNKNVKCGPKGVAQSPTCGFWSQQYLT